MIRQIHTSICQRLLYAENTYIADGCTQETRTDLSTNRRFVRLIIGGRACLPVQIMVGGGGGGGHTKSMFLKQSFKSKLEFGNRFYFNILLNKIKISRTLMLTATLSFIEVGL